MDSTIAPKIFSGSTVQEVFDDLCHRSDRITETALHRFIVHLPKVELKQVERICFQIEEAHWYYEDFLRDLNPHLPNYNLKVFIETLISHIPPSLTSQFESDNIGNAFASFMAYKQRVPVRGAIMLNLAMDKCVLVKGWKSSATWAFPRGKIDAEEGDLPCAIREVAEETSFDLTGYIKEGDYIEMTLKAQNIRLFVAPGVPEDVEFAPRTRKEISKIQWHDLADLPGYNFKKNGKEQFQQRSGRYYMVAPFMKALRKWIATKGKKWLMEQQNKATAQNQAEFQDAAANLPTVEYETEVEDGPRSPPKDPADGLRALLGIDRAREVVQHGQMTQAEQEDASRRLKDMLLGKQPSAVASSHGVGQIGGGQSGAHINGGHTVTAPVNPNAQSLLSILKGGNPAPQQPPSVPPPQLQENIPIPFAAQMGQFTQFSGQPPPPFGQRQPVQFASQPPPQHLPGYGQGPGFPPFSHPQQQLRDTAMPPLYQPGAGLPQFSHLNEWQNAPITPTTPTNTQTRGSGLPPAPTQHHPPNGARPNHPPMPPQQAPPTPKESFIRMPVTPSKPPDAAQAGALLSILKGTIVPPSASPAPAPASVTTSAPAPPAPTATHISSSPNAPRQLNKQQQDILQMLNPNIQPQQQPQPQPPTSPRRGRQTPPQQSHFPSSTPTSPRRQPPHSPRQHLTPTGPRQLNSRRRENSRPSTAHPHNNYPPPPHRPGSVQPVKPSPLLRNITPTIIDQYGIQKPTTPAPPPINFDRRKSMTGDRQASLLAMFTSKDVSAENSAEAVEGNVGKDTLEIPRFGTPGPMGLGQGKAKAKSPMGKERAGLLAYLEDVAKMG
ncbi:DCP2-domain-containing protein [Ascodesmis nigricans]|uniref:DCP2-domain-containing protein n=1 Tax=Ascodesmis nigricans TaxID=341454 RepID=A0A4S2N4E1_9PEZI|nr:DCP2-domain-containing protein [Ascodesmis nigricans]